MRLILATVQPVQEIAAEPATLGRLRELLHRRAEHPTSADPVIGAAPSLLGLPLVPDPNVPPLTVHLRPRATPPEHR